MFPPRSWPTRLSVEFCTNRVVTPTEVAEHDLTAKEMQAFAWLERERGALALSHGRMSDALAHLNRAAASFPGYWQTDEQLANLLAAEGHFEDAAASYGTSSRVR